MTSIQNTVPKQQITSGYLNLAERDLRTIKTQQKISGTSRNQRGARAFCRIRSYISTVGKKAVTVIDAIENIFKGRSVYPINSKCLNVIIPLLVIKKCFLKRLFSFMLAHNRKTGGDNILVC